VSEGDEATVGSYGLEVLWPPIQALSEPGNDSSVVISLVPDGTCGECVSGLFLGDLGETPQRMMQGRHALGFVEVVKVSHHGSSDQHDGLYRALASPIALIGVGAENSYGHPAQSVLDVLAETGLVVRSDHSGTSTLHKNEAGDIVVWSER
jgi:competence protein ComEC